MQQPLPEITLDDILITEELSRRSPRSPNLISENQALHTLARQLANQPEMMLQSLVDMALNLCYAGTTGVSLLETTPDGEDIFRWNVLAGTLSQDVGGTTARNFSPCGTCLERGSPQLFYHPERYFTYFQAANTPIVEGLVLPIIADNHAFGTIWIMSHSEQRHFDSEDVRVMTSLADFTAAALLVNQRQTRELLAANAALEAEIAERKQVEISLRASEALSHAIIENLPGGAAFVVDRDLRYVLAEGEALSVAGFKPEDLVGQTIFEVMPKELTARYEMLYRQALAGEPFEHEHNAHNRSYISRGTPLRLPNGEIYAALAISYDISDRKQAEAALADSRRQFEKIAATTPDLVYVFDLIEERNTYVNAGIHQVLGYSQAQIATLGSSLIGSLIHPDDIPGVIEGNQRFRDLDDQEVYDHELRMRHATGEYRWLRCRDSVFERAADGTVTQIIGTAQDVTDRKQAEATLRESEARQAFLLRVSDVLRSLADPVEIEEAVTQTAMNYFGADRCYYCEIEDDNAIIWRDAAREDLPSVAGVYPLSRFAIFKAVVDAGRPFIVHDVHTSDRLDEDLRQFCIQLQVISFVDVPVIKNGKPVGILCLVQSTPRDWTDLEVELAVETAERTWAAVERARTEVALAESEAKYRTLFESIDEGFCVFELLYDENGRVADYRFLQVNPVFERQTGLKDAAGKLGSEIAPHTETHWLEAYDRVARTGKPLRLENYNQATGRWYEAYASRIDGAGSRQVCTVFNDISERKRAEDALRESEKRFRLFVTAASEMVYRMSADWSQRHTLEGKSFLADTRNPSLTWLEEYIPDSDKPLVQAAIAEAVRAKTMFELEHRVIRADGTVGWTFSRAIPFLDERGEIDEWFGAAQDVTDRKQAEADRIQLIQEQTAREEERQRAEALAQLDRAKTAFFSNVSHEFRTPLTLLLAPLQDALSDRTHPLPQAQQERLELAHQNATRLLKLVNTLLDFSRIEADRMEAVYEPTDLALYTTELASVFRSAIERAGLRLIVDCPPLPEPVYVDQQMWEKIVLNLLSNAFKFTFTGEITVRLHPANDQVILQIQDTGIGIPPEELPHLFERFYQVRGSKARTHEGSGIGLALVQELIRLHSGTVDVSSTVGQGTCFTVNIPLGTNHLPNDRIQAARTLVSTALGAAPYVEEAELWLPAEAGEDGEDEEVKLSPSPPSPPSARILLVDDNADMRDYLTRILSEHVQVEAVADGAAALAAAQEQVPDLVLSDIMMPGLDGFELVKALRKEACTREVPIILLSARAGEKSVIEGLQAGADDYLIKPFSAQELITRVLAHLQMAHIRLEALHHEKTINQKKDKFLAEVSHELNTPLVAILGWTRLLRSSPPNPAMLSKSLETIERNATLQAKLIQDLLDISRITTGKVHLNLQPVELQLVIETAIATLLHPLETKDIRLECILDPVSMIVQGDPDRLQQIVLNLLTNAVKFTPQGGRIEVRLEIIKNIAQIVVSDNGCGISAEFLPYIFETFRQSESSKGGLGLGLAIAHHLVELHGGTIRAESLGIGQGATFTVNLPLNDVNI